MSRSLIFTRYSTVPIAHIAPAVIAAVVAAQASIAPVTPGYQSRAVAVVIESDLSAPVRSQPITLPCWYLHQSLLDFHHPTTHPITVTEDVLRQKFRFMAS